MESQCRIMNCLWSCSVAFVRVDSTKVSCLYSDTAVSLVDRIEFLSFPGGKFWPVPRAYVRIQISQSEATNLMPQNPKKNWNKIRPKKSQSFKPSHEIQLVFKVEKNRIVRSSMTWGNRQGLKTDPSFRIISNYVVYQSKPSI